MPKKEQIRRERYSQGSSIRACIVKVDKDAKGPMITVSRTSPEFLKKLFAQEVPEIYEGIIEVKSVAREAGGRSKIAVYSRDDRVDAVGACVGMKGSRVQAVVNELSGERIDIVPWNDDISAFVSRALSPAKISSVRADSENKTVLVVVEEEQLSLAIGKEGQNVRLASRLTGWQIDLTTTRELEQRERLQEHLTMSIEEMVGVTPKIAEKLKAIGVTTVQKLAKTQDDALLGLPGIGPKTVTKLRETAAGTIKELEKALVELMEKENEERRRAKAEEKPLFDETIHGPEEKKERRERLTEEKLFAGASEKQEGPEAEPQAEEDTVGDEPEEEATEARDEASEADGPVAGPSETEADSPEGEPGESVIESSDDEPRDGEPA
jgi:N utilization substance protein A